MVQFLTGKDLSTEIQKLLAEPGVRCAVAFWGSGAQDLVTEAGARIICNLRMGGTNPHALRQVKAEMRKRDDLHAKVYIGATRGIVSSANVSANGLGLQSVEQAGWIEAGVLVTEIERLHDWFEALWSESQTIGKADWAAAEKAWQARTKPTLTTFDAFDPDGGTLPLVNWVRDGEWETCRDAIEAKFQTSNDELVRQVDEGLELEHPDDEKILVGRWVLCWVRGKNGPPPASGRPWWVRLGHTVVKGGFRYDGEKKRRDVVMAAETMPPVPFDPTEKRFVAALRAVLARPEYAPLLADEYEAPWFKRHEALTKTLWHDVQIAYQRL